MSKYVVTSTTTFSRSVTEMPAPPENDGPWELVSTNTHTVAFRGYLGKHVPVEHFKPEADSTQVVLVALWRSVDKPAGGCLSEEELALAEKVFDDWLLNFEFVSETESVLALRDRVLALGKKAG